MVIRVNTFGTTRRRKMINEDSVRDLLLEIVLNSRYITDEEAEEMVEELIDGVLEDIEDYADYVIAQAVSNG